MAIKIEMLRCFATVARSGNLSDAADRLGRTPSAVSMMLKQFEDHLDVPLFESDRKSKLTAFGMFTLDEALREIEHFERTISSIENFASAKAGFVRIAVVPSVAEAFLPRVVLQFLKDHPKVQIDIQDMDSASVLREIERERIDLGIASGVETNTEIICEELYADTFGIVCHASHPLAKNKRELSWRDLTDYPFIANGLCIQIADKKLQKAVNESNLKVRNTTSLLALVRSGVGITVLPQLVVDRAQSDIRFLPVSDVSAKRRIDILMPSHTNLSPAARDFAQIIREVMAADNQETDISDQRKE